MLNKVNALDYYKSKIKELSKKGEYVQSVNVKLTCGIDNDLMGLDWLFNYYSPTEDEFLSMNDESEITEDGTILHDITIWIQKEG